MKFKALLFVLLFFPVCSTVQRSTVSNLSEVAGTIKTEIKDDNRIDQQTKNRWAAIIKSLESENLELRNLLSDRDKIIDDQKKTLANLNESLADTSRDAGKADGLGDLALWIIGIIVLGLVAFVLYLVSTGKIRVPGFIG